MNRRSRLLVVFFLIAVHARGAALAQSVPPSEIPDPVASGDFDRFRLDDHNLTLELPGGRWKRVEISPESDEAGSVQWKRTGDILLVVRTEELSPRTPDNSEAWLRTVLMLIAQSASTVDLVDQKPETVAGVEGIRFKADLKVRSSSVRAEGWVGMSKGICYRVIVQGRRTQAMTITSDVTRALARATLINPDKVAGGQLKAAESPIISERMGVRVVLPEGEAMDVVPEVFDGAADGGVGLRQGAWTFLTVQSINLGKLTFTDEELLAAAGHRFTLRTPESEDDRDWAAKVAAAWKMDDLGGARRWIGTFRRGTPAQRVIGRLAVIIRGPVVVFVQAWSALPSHQETLLAKLIDGVELLPAPAEPPQPPAPGDLTPGERTAHGVVLGTIASNRKLGGDGQGAIPFYLKAAEYTPDDDAIIDSALELMEEMGQFRQAAAMLQNVPPPKDPKLAAARLVVEARVRAGAGDAAGAEAAYQKFFATGRRDDAVLEPYLDLLAEAGRHADILKAIDELASGRAETFLGHRAQAIARMGKPEEGFSLLKPAAEATPTDWASLWMYIDLLIEFERFSEARDFSDKMLGQEPGSAGLLVRRGRAEMALGWFGKARESFEAALQRVPGNKTVMDDLAAATRALGQGDRKLLAKGIDPVAIPEDLLKAAGEPMAADGPVLVELNARAIAFAPGKPLRTTRILRQKAVTRAGVDALSTMEFELDPAYERICINTVRVIDPQGTVTEADPATFYVTDAEAGSASEDKTVVLPAAGLTLGSTLEIVATYETLAPVDRIDYGSMRFQSGAPAMLRFLWVQTPAPVKDHLSWKVLGDVAVDVREAGVAFVASRVPATRSEAGAAPQFEWERFVIYAPPGGSWEDVGSAYLAEIKACHEAAAPPDAARDALTGDDPSLPLAERVHRIAAWVQKALAYRAVNFGPRAYIPRSPDEIFRAKSGDCKDHSVLLRSLLNQAGIPAHLALYSFGLPPMREFPHRNAFDHMIVYVPGLHAPGAESGGTFLDATGDDMDAAAQGHWAHAGSLALVLDPAGPKLLEVPFREPAGEGVRITRDVLVLADGTARVEERIEIGGHDSVGYRSRLAEMPVAERTSLLADWLGANGKPAVITSLRFERLEEVAVGFRQEDSLVIIASYEQPGAFRREGDSLRGEVPMSFEHARVSVDRVTDRVAPVRLRPWSFESTTRVRAEGAVVAAEPSAPFEASAGCGEGRVTWKRGEGAERDAIVRTVRFRDLPGLFPAPAWNTYATLTESVIRACEAELRLEAGAPGDAAGSPAR